MYQFLTASIQLRRACLAWMLAVCGSAAAQSPAPTPHSLSAPSVASLGMPRPVSSDAVNSDAGDTPKATTNHAAGTPTSPELPGFQMAQGIQIRHVDESLIIDFPSLAQTRDLPPPRPARQLHTLPAAPDATYPSLSSESKELTRLQHLAAPPAISGSAKDSSSSGSANRLSSLPPTPALPARSAARSVDAAATPGTPSSLRDLPSVLIHTTESVRDQADVAEVQPARQPTPAALVSAPATGGTAQEPTWPEFMPAISDPPLIGRHARLVPATGQEFVDGIPFAESLLDPFAEQLVYRGKFAVPTQRPWLEWGRPLYTGGIYPPAKDWFGSTNLLAPHFMVYGDLRSGVGVNRNANGDANSWANRLNLDMDLKLTATERIHAFMGPLDRNGDFTRLDFTDSAEFVDRTDLRLDTLFFEGDLGAIVGGLNDVDAPFDLPFSFGFLPLIYQNGIWANDNVIGAAFAIPARHSRLFNWSNYDATFFWASDQVTSDAFQGDNNAAEFFGTAWFIDAYDGYIEADYAFVHDDVGGHRSYHNLSLAFTRRYFARVSNSVRWITNFGQSLPDDQKTASGNLLLIENSLISSYPNTLVPYCNLFYGQGRPQSLARAGIAGGILNNVGINFETDGLTGYPTLDATGHNAFGAALGVNLLGNNFSHQLVLEAAALGTTGSQAFRNALGDEYAFGLRYQKPLSNAWLFRTDHMYGWLRNAEDIRGSRVELRWKF